MRFATTVTLLGILTAASPAYSQQSTTPNRDGSTPSLAVDLSAAHTEEEGMKAERAWLDQYYPGAKVKSQSLLLGPPVMDLLKITLPSGEDRSVYFNISSYFGKM